MRGFWTTVGPKGEVEFSAFMLHRCAAVLAVNLQIDETVGREGSNALSLHRGSESKRLSVGVSNSSGYLGELDAYTHTHTHTEQSISTEKEINSRLYSQT